MCDMVKTALVGPSAWCNAPLSSLIPWSKEAIHVVDRYIVLWLLSGITGIWTRSNGSGFT